MCSVAIAPARPGLRRRWVITCFENHGQWDFKEFRWRGDEARRPAVSRTGSGTPRVVRCARPAARCSRHFPTPFRESQTARPKWAEPVRVFTCPRLAPGLLHPHARGQACSRCWSTHGSGWAEPGALREMLAWFLSRHDRALPWNSAFERGFAFADRDSHAASWMVHGCFHASFHQGPRICACQRSFQNESAPLRTSRRRSACLFRF